MKGTPFAERIVGFDEGKNPASNTAYVFMRSGATWTQRQKLTASDLADGDDYGYAATVSADGTTAAIGAPGKDGDTGAVYVFTREGERWTQQAQLLLNGGGGRFGYAVALSGTGETAVIGAPGVIEVTAFTFARAGTSWSQQQPLSYNGPGHVSLAFYASAVAMSADGTTVLVGAQTEGDQGAVYVFGP